VCACEKEYQRVVKNGDAMWGYEVCMCVCVCMCMCVCVGVSVSVGV